MEEASSPTDVSSSLSEFVRQEKLLKEIYRESKDYEPSRKFEPLRYNDEEIDTILQQMGRLLSPVGQESDNKIYKHVVADAENKSIEQILIEAKELINDSMNPADCSSILSSDDVSSVNSTDDIITFINVEDGNDADVVNGNYADPHDHKKFHSREMPILHTYDILNGNTMPQKQKYAQSSKEFSCSRNVDHVDSKKLPQNKSEGFRKELQILRDEVKRVNQLYESCKAESVNLRKEMARLELQWEQREKVLLEENRQLKKNSSSSVVSQKELKNFQSRIESANETIAHLKSNLNKSNEEWRKKEMRLTNECEQLRHQLKSGPKFAQPDIERLQEQLKDTQEVNVKLKMDFESYKDKCTAMENLCADFKKVIEDEQMAEKLYANDDTPASVKHFLSSSPSSVLNTLTHMFGCLSRSARNRPYSGQKDKNELFTTYESSTMHDLSKSHEHHDLIRELLKEKEQLRKENVDLNRQVKELETIVRRRAHPNFSHVSEIIKSGESKMYEKESEAIKNLKKELLDKQHVIIGLKNQIVESKATYDQNLLALQAKIVNIQEESLKMKEEVEKNCVKKATTATTTTASGGHLPKCKRKPRSCEPPPHSARNFRVELSAKEREVLALNKQIDELKKTNRKLMKDKENHHLASKEQSAENIQLNSRFAKTSCEKRTRTGSTSVESPKRNVELENQNLPSDHVEQIALVEMKTPETATMNSPVTNLQTDAESKSENLQQVLCDFFKVLAKEKISDQNNPSDDVQPEEFRRFVAALKNFSN